MFSLRCANKPYKFHLFSNSCLFKRRRKNVLFPFLNQKIIIVIIIIHVIIVIIIIITTTTIIIINILFEERFIVCLVILQVINDYIKDIIFIVLQIKYMLVLAHSSVHFQRIFNLLPEHFYTSKYCKFPRFWALKKISVIDLDFRFLSWRPLMWLTTTISSLKDGTYTVYIFLQSSFYSLYLLADW